MNGLLLRAALVCLLFAACSNAARRSGALSTAVHGDSHRASRRLADDSEVADGSDEAENPVTSPDELVRLVEQARKSLLVVHVPAGVSLDFRNSTKRLVVHDGQELEIHCSDPSSEVWLESSEQFLLLGADSKLSVFDCAVAALPFRPVAHLGDRLFTTKDWHENAVLSISGGVAYVNCEVNEEWSMRALTSALTALQPEATVTVGDVAPNGLNVLELFFDPFVFAPSGGRRLQHINTTWVCTKKRTAVDTEEGLWNEIASVDKTARETWQLLRSSNGSNVDLEPYYTEQTVKVAGTVSMSAAFPWQGATVPLARPLAVCGPAPKAAILDVSRVSDIFRFDTALTPNEEDPRKEAMLRFENLTLVNLPVGPRFDPEAQSFDQITALLWVAEPAAGSRDLHKYISCSNCIVTVECEEVNFLQHIVKSLNRVRPGEARNSVQTPFLQAQYELGSLSIRFARLVAQGVALLDTVVTCEGPAQHLLMQLHEERNFSFVQNNFLVQSVEEFADAPNRPHTRGFPLWVSLVLATLVVAIATLSVAFLVLRHRKWNPPVQLSVGDDDECSVPMKEMINATGHDQELSSGSSPSVFMAFNPKGQVTDDVGSLAPTVYAGDEACVPNPQDPAEPSHYGGRSHPSSLASLGMRHHETGESSSCLGLQAGMSVRTLGSRGDGAQGVGEQLSAYAARTPTQALEDLLISNSLYASN